MAADMHDRSDEAGAAFAEYWATRSRKSRDDLVVRFMPLVRQIATQFVRTSGSRDDLEQVGYLGLIKSVERFDPAFGVPFEAYARTVIAGEISHYLRDLAPILRVPRWYRTLNRRMHEAHDRLSSSLHREPTIEELADAMNVDPDGVREILRLRDAYNLASLSDDAHVASAARYDALRSKRALSFQLPVEDRIALDRAIDRLAEVERSLIQLFFYKDLTQTEIARRLGFSQKHISRLLAQSLRKLKEDLR
ncbi:MAG TPA: sigma-70 family RNA polymerase sigma factor [Candidatus Eremiobacteraceae bacterium]|jgi:RNA polymerase sigma-B factor